MISEFLFYDESAPKEEKTNYVNLKIEIRELLNNELNRKVLIDILMDLRKDLSGSTLDKLFELYQSLGLHHDSYKKLESWRWQTISKGIFELTQMHVEESFGFVTKFINNKNSTIRKQAEIATITLKHEGINYFLDTTTYRISEWQQLKILEVLKNKSDFQPPSFKYWLISKNKDVVLFAVRLMKHYNQTDGNQALIELLKHKNDEIKTAAINCIKEFNVVEAMEILKLVFWNSSVDIKINILDAISTLGNTSDLEFLKSIGVKDSNFNVKSKALATINAIAPMTVMPTKDIQNVDKFMVPKDISTEVLQEYNTVPIAPPEVEEEVPETPEIQITAPLNEASKENVEQVVQKSGKLEIVESSIESSNIDPEFENSFKIDFLPIVTEKRKEVAAERYHPKSGQVDMTKDLLELEVIFNTEQFDSTEETEHTESSTIDDFKNAPDLTLNSPSLDFLPIVIPSAKEVDVNADVSKKAIEILNIPVIHSEVKSEAIEPKENKILSELNALVPLPKPPKIKKKAKDKLNVGQNLKESSSINNIDMKKVNKIECKGVEIRVESQKTFQENIPETEPEAQKESVDQIEQVKQNALDWIMALNEAQVELKQKIKSIVTKQEVSSLRLPKPIFYTDHEANMVALLDDIEALGDKREVPLLQDMLLEKENSSIRERIEFLIEKISDTEVLTKEMPAASISNDAAFSVFEEFFRTADTESKLILLDEIVAVGDEKEIDFLKQLVKKAVPKVKNKAKACLEGLTAKLSREKNVEHIRHPEQEKKVSQNQSPTDNDGSDHLTYNIEQETLKPFDVFDIDFELAFDENEKPEQTPR